MGKEVRRTARGRPIVYFSGEAHEMDERACRLALLRRQVDRAVADSMQGFADELGISRSTASRWCNRFCRVAGLGGHCPGCDEEALDGCPFLAPPSERLWGLMRRSEIRVQVGERPARGGENV